MVIENFVYRSSQLLLLLRNICTTLNFFILHPLLFWLYPIRRPAREPAARASDPRDHVYRYWKEYGGIRVWVVVCGGAAGRVLLAGDVRPVVGPRGDLEDGTRGYGARILYAHGHSRGRGKCLAAHSVSAGVKEYEHK